MRKNPLSDLYKEIGEKWGVTPETVEKVERDFWLQIRLSIAEGEGKQFLINYFGSFWIPLRKRQRFKERVLDKLNLGVITEEEAKIRLERIDECIQDMNSK